MPPFALTKGALVVSILRTQWWPEYMSGLMVGQNITVFYLGISPDPRIAATRSYTNWSSFPRGLIVCSIAAHYLRQWTYLLKLQVLVFFTSYLTSSYWRIPVHSTFFERTCPASALVGLVVPLLLVVIPGGERHKGTTFHSGCSCWSSLRDP